MFYIPGDESPSHNSRQEATPGTATPTPGLLLPALRDPRHTQEGTPWSTPERGNLRLEYK